MVFNDLYSEYEEKLSYLCYQASEHLLLANIDQQQIEHIFQGRSLKVYKMSSSKQPPSCVENSLGTPWGLHRVCQKIGEGQASGMVFEGRVPIGLIASECSNEKQKKNLITSRILRLEGLEKGVNRGGVVDTFDRYVYIHGTNHEQNLGTPSSSGCLQLSNACVIELFNLIPEHTHLYVNEIASIKL
ncbi:MAG: L,D-transpeptidase [Opitutales bacterium]|nr:L,D-transpeptidase [Opitutales bacterium]